MADWEFEHSIYTDAHRDDVWNYWSDLHNHAEVEPGVKRIELDGPFETGTTGRTITENFTQEWELTSVTEGERFVITGKTPDGSGTLRFAWEFKDEGSGTRMTQRIEASGPQVEEYEEEFRQMAVRAPESMEQLATLLDELAENKWNDN